MSAPDPKRLRTSPSNLLELAQAAVAAHPDSDLEIALQFVKETVPRFCKESNDRLLKVGRNLKSLVQNVGNESLFGIPKIKAGLELQVQECEILSSTCPPKVPKVRFGKTDLQMPIITLGCMRFQQQWGTSLTKMNQISTDCQDNLVAILRRAILEFGINHIETARGYGCSELQLGCAFQQLFASGEIQRKDLIIQTKVPPYEDPNEFREQLEQSLASLQLDYIDLFGFHGLNGTWQWDWMFRDDPEKGNCWQVIQEYRQAGRIRFVGFSTHGPTDLIHRLIETDKFDYANVHHHFCGSYTASGDGPGHEGNISCLRKMKERDMGAFIISPCDKGGKIYEPSQKMRSLALPDCEPMAFGLGWLWNLHRHQGDAEAHTLTIGAARPSDLDQLAVAAHLQQQGALWPKIEAVSRRMQEAQVDALGQEWLDTCYDGTIKSYQSKYMVEHNQMIWMYNCLKAWGMLAFCKDRYNTFVNNSKNYDAMLSMDENIDAIGRRGYGFTPGVVPEAGKNYFVDDLSGVPDHNRARIREAYEFVMQWCAPKPEAEKEALAEIPVEFQTSYEMKPWKDYPDRKYPY